MAIPLDTIVPNAVRNIFSQLDQIVKVVVIERKRPVAEAKQGSHSVSPDIDPIGGFATSSRNRFDPNLRTITQAEDENVWTTLGDIEPFPTAASPNPLPRSPSGVARFAIQGMLLSPKVKLVDVLKGRTADLKMYFEPPRMPMLDGRRLIPDAQDKIRVGDIVFTVDSAKTDPTGSLITAELMRGNLAGDFT